MGKRQQDWRHRNPDKARAADRRRYLKHRDKIIASVSAWQKANRPKIQATRRAHDVKLRQDVFTLLGNVCLHCGFTDPRALQIDHVNGGGNKELKKLGHSRAVYARVLRVQGAGYQLLCANCNTIKMKESLYGQTYDGRTKSVA